MISTRATSRKAETFLQHRLHLVLLLLLLLLGYICQRVTDRSWAQYIAVMTFNDTMKIF